MKILAIETATEACSAALYLNGEITQRHEVAPRRHTELILPMVESLLAEARCSLSALDALAFGRGPGAFTGVRIATGVVQGLALGANLPVVPVSTLAALALEVFQQSSAGHALVALDARMGEVYWGVYRRRGEPELVDEVTPESVIAPERVPLPEQSRVAAIASGPGWKAYGESLRRRVGTGLLDIWPERLPRAAQVARLAVAAFARDGGVSPEEAVPVYLRNQVANHPAAKPR